MAAVAHLVAHPEIPHGTVKVAFNPDEEIGRGVIHFPVESFGAAAAYTVDGSTTGELQSETFSGAQVRMRIRGRAIHPGWAKGELVNAIKLAARDPRAPPAGQPLAGDDRRTRGLRPPRARRGRLVGGRAPLHRPRLRDDRSTSTSPSCAASPRRSAAAEPRCSIDGRGPHPVPEHARHARAASRDRREPRGGDPPRRPRAEADGDPRRHRRLRPHRDGPARRRTSSPAATTRTASASGSASRTWASPRRRSSSSPACGPSS